LTSLASLAARFPDRELAIRRLCHRDSEFLGVCEDYEEAVAALRRWQARADEAKAEEYRRLVAELEEEILGDLARPPGV
jgi:hypothetical protein